MSMAPRMSGNSNSNSINENNLGHNSLTPSRRKSVGDSHRLSSIPPPTTMRTDSRPIAEKQYFTTCVRRLYQYLDNNDYCYENPIKLKDLQKPSGKDFQGIMTFLMKKIDPNFNSSPKRKFEDEVVTAFKVMGYPFNISKTALVAAGSPHTWPTLLLAISWLIELLEGREGFAFLNEEVDGISSVGEAGGPFADAQTLENRSEKAFLKYVEISYNSFLSGDDALLEKLEVDLLQYFEKDNIMIEQVIETQIDENNAKAEEILEIRGEGGDLPQRESNLEDLANDIEKFAMLVQQLTEHKATLAKKVDDNTAQLKSKEEEIEKKEAKLNHLRSVIENQAFSKEDIHKLENEKANMEEKVRQTRKMKEVNEQATLTKAMELNKMFGYLHPIVEAFNSRIEALFPKEDEASPYMISIQKDAAHEQDQSILLGGVDLKGTLVPKWSREKQQHVENISQLRRDLFDLTDNKEESDEAVSDIKGDIEVLVPTRRRAAETLQREKEEQDKMLDDKRSDLDTLKTKVNSLQDHEAFEKLISQLQARLDELETFRKDQHQTNNSTKQAMLGEIRNLRNTILNSRSRRKISARSQAVRRIEREIQYFIVKGR